MLRGQKIEIDLGSDSDEDGVGKKPYTQAMPGAFVGDVLERTPADAKPPSVPTLKSKTGFPEHQKRKSTTSRFKQQQPPKQSAPQLNQPIAATPLVTEARNEDYIQPTISGDSSKPETWEEKEKTRIDQENRQRLAEMSPEELEEERRELMRNLNPAIIQRLMQRSHIDSGSNETDLSKPIDSSRHQVTDPVLEPVTKPAKQKIVSFAAEPAPTSSEQQTSTNDQHSSYHDDKHGHDEQEEHDSINTSSSPPQPPSTLHFPQPPQPPSLDPSSSTFLTDLHEKYFPSLPTDPSKLAWMQNPSTSTSSYSPLSPNLPAASIRFSFLGQLLPPTTAALIPVTEGLHHHADAPEAAGYTLPELALLARSSYPAQRCIAFQTLGRVLYRLGRGEFGDSGEAEGRELENSGGEGAHEGGDGTEERRREETFGELARGLWGVVEKEKIIEILVRESEGLGVDGGRHVSAKAYATEAVWLWRKGGGRRWKAE